MDLRTGSGKCQTRNVNRRLRTTPAPRVLVPGPVTASAEVPPDWTLQQWGGRGGGRGMVGPSAGPGARWLQIWILGGKAAHVLLGGWGPPWLPMGRVVCLGQEEVKVRAALDPSQAIPFFWSLRPWMEGPETGTQVSPTHTRLRTTVVRGQGQGGSPQATDCPSHPRWVSGGRGAE